MENSNWYLSTPLDGEPQPIKFQSLDGVIAAKSKHERFLASDVSTRLMFLYSGEKKVERVEEKPLDELLGYNPK